MTDSPDKNSRVSRPIHPTRSALRILVIGLVLFATVFWAFRIHGPGHDTYKRTRNNDHFAYFYPTTMFMHDELRAGRLPVWNPYQMAGQPFMAMPVRCPGFEVKRVTAVVVTSTPPTTINPPRKPEASYVLSKSSYIR